MIVDWQISLDPDDIAKCRRSSPGEAGPARDLTAQNKCSQGASATAAGGAGGNPPETQDLGQLVMALPRGHFIPLKCGQTRPALI
jgi:hypothetical protein